MALDLATQTSILRHLDYSVLGMYSTTTAGGSLAMGTAVSYRYTQAYGQLLWRLQNLNAAEECRISGDAYASLTFVGPVPNSGDFSTITITGGGLASPVSLTLTATPAIIDPYVPSANLAALGAPYANANVGLGLAAQVALLVAQSPALVAAGFTAQAPYGTGPFSQNIIPTPEVSIKNPAAFSVTVANTGMMAVQVVANGALLPPFMSPNTQANPIYGYIPILDYLEQSYANSTNILQIDTADVFKRAKSVLGESYSLYRMWVMRLANYLNVPINSEVKNSYNAVSPRAFM